ncbi:hypothetical protein LHGZ1_2592 [Laribacter hongkongensis]|uniref:Uncharacterized protein n=1 Tax=Laribacter hongkongensis TaxID=168471 RepID=A0A248LMN3_9NEIS|nr:hypothetical protein LHGZ1_2592 [Laribacter hongkongensis]
MPSNNVWPCAGDRPKNTAMPYVMAWIICLWLNEYFFGATICDCMNEYWHGRVSYRNFPLVCLSW